jgi:hypothetical protein
MMYLFLRKQVKEIRIAVVSKWEYEEKYCPRP